MCDIVVIFSIGNKSSSLLYIKHSCFNFFLFKGFDFFVIRQTHLYQGKWLSCEIHLTESRSDIQESLEYDDWDFSLSVIFYIVQQVLIIRLIQSDLMKYIDVHRWTQNVLLHIAQRENRLNSSAWLHYLFLESFYKCLITWFQWITQALFIDCFLCADIFASSTLVTSMLSLSSRSFRNFDLRFCILGVDLESFTT